MSQLEESAPYDAAQLADVPRGALAVAGTAVGLLVLAWLIVYFAVFIPRGAVG
jgi:hypothetical protein